MNKFLIGIMIVAVLVTGCASPKKTAFEEKHPVIITSESKKVEPSAAETSGNQQKVAEVIKSKVVVAVKDTSKKSDDTTKEIVAKVEGQLIEDGFLVKETASFMTVQVGTEIKLFDKQGNYYVYEGVSDAEIKRNDSKKIGAKQFIKKGKRQLEQSRAKRSVADQISDDVSSWVSKTCTAKTMGIETIVVTLRVSEWESWLGGSERAAKKKIQKFTESVMKQDGILSCILIDRAENNRQFQLRIVYETDKFQNGVLTGSIERKTLPGKKFEINPVLWLFKTVFKTTEVVL